MFYEVRGAFTNTPPIDAYRGAGKPEANYLIERLVNLAAIRTGIDAVKLRRRNIVSKFPHRTAMGMKIDGGRFKANLDDAIALADREGFRKRRKQSEKAGLLRGLGIACFLETSRGVPLEMARAAFEADGTVSLAVGTQSNGQGHETAYPQVAADMLGLPIDAFRFQQGDTDLLPGGNGHGGARSMHMGGTALVMAIEKLIEKGKLIAAHLLQAPADQVSFADGRFVVQGTERAIEIGKLADAARDPANLPEGMTPGLEGSATNSSDLYNFPNGCHVAEVEIDPDTGVVRLDRYTIVDDFGSLINPRVALSQVHGGVVQGIGQSLLEHVVFDPEGQLLSGSFMDYTLPRAQDLPNFAGGLNQSAPTASNPLGVKGTGQAGSIAAPQTIMNAVLDALSPLGIDELDMPATPYLVWSAIQSTHEHQDGFRNEPGRLRRRRLGHQQLSALADESRRRRAGGKPQRGGHDGGRQDRLCGRVAIASRCRRRRRSSACRHLRHGGRPSGMGRSRIYRYAGKPRIHFAACRSGSRDSRVISGSFPASRSATPRRRT